MKRRAGMVVLLRADSSIKARIGPLMDLLLGEYKL